MRETAIPIASTNYEYLKSLEWMIGTWSDRDGDVELETTCEWTKNKNFMTRSFRVKIDEQTTKEGTQVIGYDAVKRHHTFLGFRHGRRDRRGKLAAGWGKLDCQEFPSPGHGPAGFIDEHHYAGGWEQFPVAVDRTRVGRRNFAGHCPRDRGSQVSCDDLTSWLYVGMQDGHFCPWILRRLPSRPGTFEVVELSHEM